MRCGAGDDAAVGAGVNEQPKPAQASPHREEWAREPARPAPFSAGPPRLLASRLIPRGTTAAAFGPPANQRTALLAALESAGQSASRTSPSSDMLGGLAYPEPYDTCTCIKFGSLL